MSVYREGYHAIEKIQKQSKQIYPDACDFGAPVKEGDSTWNWAKQLVDWYGIKSTRKAQIFASNHKVVEVTVSLMNEWAYSDALEYGKPNVDDYTQYFKVTYIKAPKIPGNFDGFFMVEEIKDKAEKAQLKKVNEAEMAH